MNIGNKTQGSKPKAAPLTAAALSLIGLAIAGQAQAGCGNFGSPSKSEASVFFKPAIFRSDDRDGAVFRPASFGEYLHSSIIGLWKVEFLAKNNTNGIPDGALIDFGTAMWLGDGTEIMVSGGRAPSTGDVCMGAWEQTGPYTYKLNHLALAWQGGAYAGPASIKEMITLEPSGLSYHGWFTITQYAASATPGHEFDETTVVPPTPIHGTITGTRVTED
jgi:hypothetical protein